MFWYCTHTALTGTIINLCYNPDGILSQAYGKLSCKLKKLNLWSGELPHHCLFKNCAAILHHSGSGIVVTALLARKPQLTPIMFDQEVWAKQLLWKELAMRCIPLKQLKSKELVSTLRSSCSGKSQGDGMSEEWSWIITDTKLLTAAALSTSVSVA